MKKSIILTATLALSLSMFGAPTVFTVQAPAWKSLAMANLEGVYVYKAPSTSSPFLAYDETKITDYEMPVMYSAFWTTKAPSETLIPIVFDTPTPIVSEKQGWYEVMNYGPQYQQNGWVEAKFCDKIVPQPIDFAKAKKQFPYYEWIDRGSDGQYMIAMDYNEMESCVTFRVGRIINGVVVSPYELYCPLAGLDGRRRPGFHKAEGYYEFTFNKACTVDNEGYDPQISKMPKEVIDNIINYAEEAPIVVYFIHDNEIFRTF